MRDDVVLGASMHIHPEMTRWNKLFPFGPVGLTYSRCAIWPHVAKDERTLVVVRQLVYRYSGIKAQLLDWRGGRLIPSATSGTGVPVCPPAPTVASTIQLSLLLHARAGNGSTTSGTALDTYPNSTSISRGTSG